MPPFVRRARPRWLLALALVALAAHAAFIASHRLTHHGDFDVSREFGRRLLAGEPLYAGGLHYPYLPSAALAFAPLALLPPGLAFALRYAVAVAALALALRLLWSLSGVPAGRRAVLLAAVLALSAHYVLRDLDDAGPHLILLALLVAGVWCVRRGGDLAAALCIGLAAAVKAPAALLLLFFAWKRQWRLAAAAALALLAWVALPSLWMGPASWWQHQRQWFDTALASAAGAPGAAQLESEGRPQNQALRPAVTRLAARLGAAPSDARRAALLAAALAVLPLAWWSRRPWRGRGDRRWLPETSAVLLLSLLLSPVTWVQHLVLVIPALVVIVAAALAGRLPRWAAAALALYAVLALLLTREAIGRAAYLALLAAGLHTAAVLILLAVLVAVTPPPDHAR